MAHSQAAGPDVSVADLAFKAMTLYRLGRNAETSAAAEIVNARIKNEPSARDLSGVMSELSSLANASH